VYRGDAEERIAVQVTIDRFDDDLASLPPFSPGSFDVPIFRDGPAARRDRAMNLRQLEQQQQKQQQQQQQQ